MIAAETDLRHRVSRNTAQIDKLIAETTVDMGVQQCRNVMPGKPAVIVKDMNAGPGVPGAVQDDICHFRVEILTVENIAFDRVNARPVAGNKKSIPYRDASFFACL